MNKLMNELLNRLLNRLPTKPVKKALKKAFRRFRQDRPIALVYRGPASTPGCPESVAKSLAVSRWNFDIHYVGPEEKLQLSKETLSTAAVYVQPGGDEQDVAYEELKQHHRDIRKFVKSGGNYLGFCLGGYLAGPEEGFDLLPGTAERHIDAPGATVKTTECALVEFSWRGQPRTLFFQDGPSFSLNKKTSATVLATYPDQTIAAMVTRFGRGRVGVVGPHPEATAKWFTDVGLDLPAQLESDLTLDLVDEVMSR